MTSNDFEFWSAEMNLSTPTIDIHGLRPSEAAEKIEHFIDLQLMGPYKSVRIVHGAGTGALRDMVQKLLRQNTHILAQKESGQVHELAAVTYAILK